MKETRTYQKAFDELQILVRKMENTEISVDELTEIIKKATTLINICKKTLTDTEEEVKMLLEKM
jgi:exodeoxyribonuclease VII small subunit